MLFSYAIEGFWGWVFWDQFNTDWRSYVTRADRWVGADGWAEGWADSRRKGGVRDGFININDMYNNDVGKGVVYAYEAYEAK